MSKEPKGISISFKEIRKYLRSTKHKFCGSNVRISEMKRIRQDSFKFCGNIPIYDFLMHSNNWPLVIILDIVNIQSIITGWQIRHHRVAK